MIDLRCGDCLELMKDIPDGSVDCVIIDPPYFIDGLTNKWNVESLTEKAKKGVIIKSLPVGMKFDIQQGKDLEKFMTRVSEQVFRILKCGGFFLSFSQGRLYHRMTIAIENCGFEIRDLLIWEREGQAKAFSQNHFVNKMDISEDEKLKIIQSLNGRKTPQLRPRCEPIVLAQKPKEGTFVENWLKHGVGLIDVTQTIDGKFPSTIMNVEKPRGNEKTSHLTQKPVRLLEHLIKIFTKEDDTILDCFMGSGSTGVACLNTKRNFIGVELDKGYFDIAKQRIEAVRE